MAGITDKTLEQLDGEQWGSPEYNSSLVINCHRLRRVPLKKFTAGDLRLMIGQDLSLEYLVPLAVELLEKNPFVEGDYYPGDLLKNVLDVKREFWGQQPELERRMKVVAERASRELPSLNEIEEIKECLAQKLNDF